MKLETIAITKLTPDPENARQHDETNLKAIEGSLREFGQRKPIVISQTNVIVAGNGTVEAAKNLGWSQIQVVRVPADWDANRIKAFALADNRTAELAEWSPQVLAEQLLEIEQAGFDIEAFGFDKVKQIDEGSETQDENLPEQVVTRVKLGQLWKLGNHKLMCGDSTDESTLDKLLVDARPEMIYTDPPYGISHSGKGITGSAKANNFGAILGDADVQIAKTSFNLVSKKFDKSKIIYWGANYFCQSLPEGFGWIVWDKQREGETFSGAELAFVNQGVKVNVFRHQWHGMIKSSERGEARVHPTQKPIALAEWCFENYGKPQSVLDLFAGSGSTLMACENKKIKSFHLELDPKYCDVIIQRWENLTGAKAELVNG